MAIWLILGTLFAADGAPARPDPAETARRIDVRLSARMEAERVPPAPGSSDAEFFRRIHLDLVGRIPTIEEVRGFLADTHDDKRSRLIRHLTNDREHARHFARIWRGLLLPEAETEPQLRYFQPGFEAWLEGLRSEGAGFDRLVRELLAVPIASPDGTPEFVLRDLRKPNPLAFIAAKNAEPPKIASSAVRLFLGLRLECAQCHDHPFDHWTRQQFWNQAAFFAGIERRGKGPFAPIVEITDRRSIPLMETTELVPALYLDLSRPGFEESRSARGGFTDWVTAPGNPFFARAIANRVWGQLMGTGLVEPVDDFRDTNTSAQPEVLAELSEAFRDSGFDPTFLYRAICLTEAYQRTSRQSDPGQVRPELFARMAIKSLSGEQFFDSLAQAIGYEQPPEQPGDENEGALRRRGLSAFADDSQQAEPETSVTQALTLMNGAVLQRGVNPATSKRLRQILERFPDSADEQVEALYLSSLSRFPQDAEKKQIAEFLARGDSSEHARRLGDVFWVLLNSPEFRWNH